MKFLLSLSKNVLFGGLLPDAIVFLDRVETVMVEICEQAQLREAMVGQADPHTDWLHEISAERRRSVRQVPRFRWSSFDE